MAKETEITILVNALAVAIGNAGFDTDELAVIAAVFVQIGDTLATMATLRALNGENTGKD